ncbi:hypothetical protein ACJX0J_010023, partial [Zea mays]
GGGGGGGLGVYSITVCTCIQVFFLSNFDTKHMGEADMILNINRCAEGTGTGTGTGIQISFHLWLSSFHMFLHLFLCLTPNKKELQDLLQEGAT